MFDKMKELMEMKKQADKIKRELDSVSVEATDIRGIKIVINGSQNVQSIEIDEALLVAGNKKRFEADLMRSVNTAIRKSQNLAAQKMKAVMPGFPGL
ncbi:MAG TPA: nucleoid-associated protein, YbaB/EbfC family [Candidatus Omnitrophica bacterium]|nr:MAG: nucleoid-associated protein, YbaB/EbfC family [Omnitrophica WOR_2 bacterium GWA2_45_18]HBR14834.1 nucleoid-associated protein, YbaB/EbfC family [Candidatus Omnitrophota bacterium]